MVESIDWQARAAALEAENEWLRVAGTAMAAEIEEWDRCCAYDETSHYGHIDSCLGAAESWRALLAAQPPAATPAGPQTGDPCAKCSEPIPDAPTGNLCQRCHHEAFTADLEAQYPAAAPAQEGTSHPDRCRCPSARCTLNRLTVIHDPAVSQMVRDYIDIDAAQQAGREEEQER